MSARTAMAEDLALATEATFDCVRTIISAEDGTTVTTAAQDAFEPSKARLAACDDKTWWPHLERDVHGLITMTKSKADTSAPCPDGHRFACR